MKSFHFILTIKINKINIKCSEFVYNTYSTILQIEMLNSTIHGEHIFIAQYFLDLHKEEMEPLSQSISTAFLIYLTVKLLFVDR